MGVAALTYYTADMVRALPDDGSRYEVVFGELLVTPAPRPWHQVLLTRLPAALDAYLRVEPVGVPLVSPADISWGIDILVQPDLFVLPLEDARTGHWPAMRHLLLAVEVLNPSSTRADRFTKRRLYQERSEEHTSELQSLAYLVCRLLLEKKNRQAEELSHLVRKAGHPDTDSWLAG